MPGTFASLFQGGGAASVLQELDAGRAALVQADVDAGAIPNAPMLTSTPAVRR